MSAAVFSQYAINELSVSGIRDDHEVVVSAWVRNPSDGPAFRIIDLLGDEAPQCELMAPVRAALAEMPDEVQTALWGVSLPAEPGHVPAGFTLSVTLSGPMGEANSPANLGNRDAAAWNGAEVSGFQLDGHAGCRRVQLSTGPGVEGSGVQVLTLTYVAQTPHGILTVACGTAHLDAADVFTALFDRIAGSVRIVAVALPTVD